MSLAPAAYLLFQRFLRHDPSDADWLGRDRFVLSCGHSSLTLYIQLYLSGYGLTLDDLQSFRTWGSRTPGHPELHHTTGVETTTGPLGQGLSTAVGMAMGARYERGLLDPDAAPGTSPFDHRVWVFASDGDLEEGITSEASSLAGTQGLGALTVMWDDNHISIEDDTAVAFSEDVAGPLCRLRLARPERRHRDRRFGGRPRPRCSTRRSCRRDRTTVVHPTAHDHRLARSHAAEHRRCARSRVGRGGSRRHQTGAGLRPGADLRGRPTRCSSTRGRSRCAVPRSDRPGTSGSRTGASRSPERAALLDRLLAGALPDDLALPSFPAGKDVASRKASGQVIQALAAALPELVGRFCGPGRSQRHHHRGGGSFLPDTVTSGRPRRSAPASPRTGGSCTSGSASTRWAPCSTGWRCPA